VTEGIFHCVKYGAISSGFPAGSAAARRERIEQRRLSADMRE
jgi:hypothetical protein